jgi:hypothetical protein
VETRKVQYLPFFMGGLSAEREGESDLVMCRFLLQQVSVIPLLRAAIIDCGALDG